MQQEKNYVQTVFQNLSTKIVFALRAAHMILYTIESSGTYQRRVFGEKTFKSLPISYNFQNTTFSAKF